MDLADYYKRGSLQEGLAAIFEKSCLEIFDPTERPNLSLIEEQAKDRIIKPIEQFITSSIDPTLEIKKLELSNSSSVCGYILKNNEPVFTCLDCTADPTSVMCNNCFVNSEHKSHNYKMHLSSGNGGYCDCGDPEAFKRYYCCSLHNPNLDKLSADEGLPTDMRDRFHATCVLLLQFAVDTCLLEVQMASNSEDVRANATEFTKKWLKSELKDRSAAVLYNDEIHSYDQVIGTLTSCLSIDKQYANYFATVVDSIGRSVLKIGDSVSMLQLSNNIRSEIMQRSRAELGCLSIPASVFAAQNLCFYLLKWLTKIIQLSDGLHEILCQCLNLSSPTLPSDHRGSMNSMVFYLLIHTDDMWKAARKVLIEFFIKSMLMKPSYKQLFAALYIKHHYTIFEKFCNDKHHPEDSVTLLSVQIFTSPSLALLLISEHNALGVLVDIIRKKTFNQSLVYDEEVKRYMLVLKSSDRDNFSVWSRSFHVLRDIDYLLHNDFGDLPSKFFVALKNVLPSFLDLLVNFQDNTYCCRHLSGHIGADPEWESQFMFVMSSMYQNHMMAEFLSREENVWFESVVLSFDKLEESKPLCIRFKPQKSMLTVKSHALKGYELVELMSGEVNISHHQPLVRFISFLIECRIISHEDCLPALQKIASYPQFDIAWLTALRQFVWNMQIGANLWNRSGTSILHSAIQYTQNHLIVVGMLQRDIRLLQIAATVTDAEQFMLRIIDGFELGSWAMSLETTDMTPGKYTTEDQKTMVEELLKLLIYLVSDRITPGVGESVTFMDMVEEDLIQHLAAGPLSHSKLLKLSNDLIKKLLPADQQLKCFAEIDSLIERVAEFRHTHEQGKGHFYLRKHLYSRLNPFHIRLSKSEVSKTLHNFSKVRDSNSAKPLMSPPNLIQFSKNFESLKQLLLCDVTHHIFQNVIQNCVRSIVPKRWSETQVERVLYLILIGLAEDERAAAQLSCGEAFYPFLDRLAKSGKCSILACLETLPKGHLKMESVKELYVYTLTRINKLRGITATGDGDYHQYFKEKKRQHQYMAKIRRDRLMADMMQKQKKILAEYGDQIDDQTSLKRNNLTEIEVRESDSKCNFLVGSSRELGKLSNRSITCMLCQETQLIGSDKNSPMVLTGFVQRSTVLTQDRGKERQTDWSGAFVESELLEGSHFNSCGHGMHLRCYREFLSSGRVISRNSLHSSDENTGGESYQCPLCQNLCNIAVLVVPPLNAIFDNECELLNSKEVLFKDWLIEVRSLSQKLSESNSLFKFQISTSQFPLLCSLYCKRDLNSLIENEEVLLCLTQLRDVCAYRGLGLDITEIFGLNSPSAKGKYSIMCLTLSYTLHSIEACKRFFGKPLFDVLPDRCVHGLHAFSRIAALMPPENALKLVRDHLKLLISPSAEELISVDLFHSLVILCICLPHIINKRHTAALCFDSEKHILRLIMAAHFIQIFLSLPVDKQCEQLVDYSGNTLDALVQKWRKAAGLSATILEGAELINKIQWACLPLLRCAALLFSALTELYPDTTNESQIDSANEYKWLCQLLQLPTDPVCLLSDCGYDPSINCPSRVTATALSYPRSVKMLVPLPHDYTELLLASREFACPAMVTPSSGQPRILQPAKCLVCGELVCSNSPCCQAVIPGGRAIGGANLHALLCTGGNCLFLRVLDCTLLMISSANGLGSLHSGPYVDKYGETDEYLRRGQPLRLNSSLYQKLQEDWLMHRLPTISNRESQAWNILEI